MLVSELVWTHQQGMRAPGYDLSQLLRREGDDRDWRVQKCVDWNCSHGTYPEVWYIEHRTSSSYFSGETENGHATACLAELGCWLTQFTPKGNTDGTSSDG
jgi:hypothetical protein